uniref:protein xylosyltransferase n=1 Tax=Guillardia theta TaxID=55529 RepID=A0A7S4L784_GUITH|mmetsp:Transcript_38498/g.121318  ORF Transcript_38498/g.121318 Transcript_38498/m.121318 type:complete len:693 (+) Transcript_38498:49-2127(+)
MKFRAQNLLKWSWQDLPILLTGLAALLSWASTPEGPREIRQEEIYESLFRLSPSETCRERIRGLEGELRKQQHAVFDVGKNVRSFCHDVLLSSPPGRIYERVARANSSPPPHFPSSSSASRPGARLVSIAFILLIGPRDSAASVDRLVEYVVGGDDVLVVHVDSKADGSLRRRMEELEKERGNVFLLPRSLSVTWGGFSMVKAQLEMMKFVVRDERVRRRGRWDVLINLSGQDIPLMPKDVLKKHLSGQGAMNWMQLELHNSSFSMGGWAECDNRMWRVVQSRSPPRGMILAQGSQWFILSRDFVSYITACLTRTREVAGEEEEEEEEEEVEGVCERGGAVLDRWACTRECGVTRSYSRWARHSFIPDESFFQTVLVNSPFCQTLFPDNLRHINWEGYRRGAHAEAWRRRRRSCANEDVVVGGCGNSPDPLTAEDVVELLRDNLQTFARKVDVNYDERVWPLVECWFARQSGDPADCLPSSPLLVSVAQPGPARIVTLSASNSLAAGSAMDGDLRSRWSLHEPTRDFQGFRPLAREAVDSLLLLLDSSRPWRRPLAALCDMVQKTMEAVREWMRNQVCLTVELDASVRLKSLRLYWEKSPREYRVYAKAASSVGCEEVNAGGWVRLELLSSSSSCKKGMAEEFVEERCYATLAPPSPCLQVAVKSLELCAPKNRMHFKEQYALSEIQVWAMT